MAEKRSYAITEGSIKLSEFERREWVANIELGVSVEDIQDPAYWALVAKKISPYDHIEARAEDGSWIAFLIVTGCDRTWAKVAVDRVVRLTTSDVSMSQADAKHRLEWKGPMRKWTVIRASDSEVVRDGFTEKDQARLWMREHEKVVG
jgi:hypothetical protein